MRHELLSDLLAARAAGRPVALATNLRTGKQRLIFADETKGDLCLDMDMIMAAGEALKADRNVTLKTPAGDVFVHVHNPPPRMFLIGAVHIAQPLARIAGMAGYGVTVIDPRRSFAGGGRFEGIDVTSEWPDEALLRLKPDSRSAVVTLTHDPKLDDAALEVALRSPAFYIGSLGSKKTHAARLERLRRAGFTDGELGRIHGPVGLAIGAVSPAEIAISVMAQITQVRRRAEGA
jgi:xanthine dehydrogenase accessory factor